MTIIVATNANLVNAKTNSIKLLTVSEGTNTGGTAELILETKPGTGRVFLETTNIIADKDTQFSFKIAKEIVCKNYNFNCNNYDFYYTLQGSSSYITGPSGGAGIAILTYSNLAGKNIPEDISLTGTINSGGFIGLVGGVKEKIGAAGNTDITKIYIPFGNRYSLVDDKININNVNIFNITTNNSNHTNSTIISSPENNSNTNISEIIEIETNSSINNNTEKNNDNNISNNYYDNNNTKYNYDTIINISKNNKNILEEINSTNNTTNETKNKLYKIDLVKGTKKLDLVEYGDRIGIKVVEVGDLDDVLEDLYKIKSNNKSVDIPNYYITTMQGIAQNICDRAEKLHQNNNEYIEKINKTDYSEYYTIINDLVDENNSITQSKNVENKSIKNNTTKNNTTITNIIQSQTINETKISINETSTNNATSNISNINNTDKIKKLIIFQSVLNQQKNISRRITRQEELLNYSKFAIDKKDYYSAASYCFGANVEGRYIQFITLNLTDAKNMSNDKLNLANELQKKEFTNLNDVETHAIVEERLIDAQNSFDNAKIADEKLDYFDAMNKYSYALERANTAISWAGYYNHSEKEIIIDNTVLQYACDMTVQDAQERINYFKLYWPNHITSEETLSTAYDKKEKKDYSTCIYYAQKAKAEADALTSVIGVDEDDLKNLLEVKEKITKRTLLRHSNTNSFPLIGYSYYEYGISLKETAPNSALLYFQMAQEFSNLDVFINDNNNTLTNPITYYLITIIPAMLMAVLILKFINRD